MKKIILTGFYPFANYKYNPTEELAHYYNAKSIADNRYIIGLVLPCTYFGAFNILSEIIDKEKPYAIISVGLASTVRGLRFETKFQNLMNGKYEDADGFKPESIPINSGIGASEFLTPIGDYFHLMGHLMEENIPIEISTFTGGFICNSLAYLTTQKIINEKLDIKNLFIHIPWTDDYADRISLEPGKVFLNKQKLYSAIELLMKYI